MYLILFLILPLTIFGFEPHPVTPYPVLGFKEVSFFDESHKINRDLLIWYPVDPELIGTTSKNPWDDFNVAMNAPIAKSVDKAPVVIISHGYTGEPHHMSWLVRSLVHEGYIVLGIQHRDLIEGKVHVNHWQRAQDISIMLDKFSDDNLAKASNLNQIGIAGFSLGGTTAIWVIGGRATKLDSLVPGKEFASPEDYIRADEALPTLNKEMMAKDWKDSRIKAAFVMAPAWSWLFDEKSLQKINIPTYLIASSADNVLVTSKNAGLFAHYIPKAIYREISGKGTHFIFISAVNEKKRKAIDPSGNLFFLFEDDISVDRRWVQSEVGEEATRFFNNIFSR